MHSACGSICSNCKIDRIKLFVARRRSYFRQSISNSRKQTCNFVLCISSVRCPSPACISLRSVRSRNFHSSTGKIYKSGTTNPIHLCYFDFETFLINNGYIVIINLLSIMIDSSVASYFKSIIYSTRIINWCLFLTKDIFSYSKVKRPLTNIERIANRITYIERIICFIYLETGCG